MPLKALLDGRPILAPLLGDTAWAELYFQRHRPARDGAQDSSSSLTKWATRPEMRSKAPSISAAASAR